MVHNQDTEDNGMAWYDDPIIVVAVAVVIIFAGGVVIYAMRRVNGKETTAKETSKNS